MNRTMRNIAPLACAAALAIVPAAVADSMMGASQPEHVAAAYAAINKFRLSAAAKDLRAAIKDSSEPAKARAHAREAYDALGANHVHVAAGHAEHGAAVEHLTYALAALNAGEDATAKDHLGEAKQLDIVSSQAKRALADIGAHKDAAAVRAVKAGLKVADSD
jgi:hypothetical protein